MKITIEDNHNGHVVRTEIYSSRVVVEYVDGCMNKRTIHGPKSFENFMNELSKKVVMCGVSRAEPH